MIPSFRALRQENDPPRTLKLLKEYFTQYPKGALYEEALALKIEALIAQKDRGARVAADEYLRRFPVGKFKPIAIRARDMFATPDED